MAARNKPYDQFGPYILFKRLESDSLSELWRAARIDGDALGPVVALRRFAGPGREAFAATAHPAGSIVRSLSGTTFARDQIIDVVNGVAFIAHDYSGGRSLRHLVDRARGVTGTTPNPIPLEQAVGIAERLAHSLATLADIRFEGARLTHGALAPQLIWITDDGEIRVAGQQLGPAFLASFGDPAAAAEYGRFFAPELQQSGKVTPATEVFALGAMLYLVTTGNVPPDPTTASAFAQVIRASKTMAGTPMPADILAIVERSLTIDPAARYATPAAMKQDLSALVHGGQYAATTFNLAFYVSSLLKKELEGEVLEREKESKLQLAPYLALPEAPVAAPVVSAAAPTEASGGGKRLPIAAAAAVALIAIGGAAWWMMTQKSAAAPPKRTPVKAQLTTSAAPKPQMLQPLIATTSTSSTTTTTTTAAAPDDEAARKKAFEQAVEQKLQEEMLKMQQEYTKKLQQQQSKQAPLPVKPAPQTASRAADTSAISAAQLDEQHLSANRQETQTASIAPSENRPAPLAPAAAVAQQAAPAVREVREGDIIDAADLDTPPHVTSQPQLRYPPMALRERAETTIFITALISENGDVVDTQVLRGDRRFGFEDAALRTVRATRFSPAIKNGKRVKTWFLVPVAFKL